jgi:hypothetical protein
VATLLGSGPRAFVSAITTMACLCLSKHFGPVMVASFSSPKHIRLRHRNRLLLVKFQRRALDSLLAFCRQSPPYHSNYTTPAKFH